MGGTNRNEVWKITLNYYFFDSAGWISLSSNESCKADRVVEMIVGDFIAGIEPDLLLLSNIEILGVSLNDAFRLCSFAAGEGAGELMETVGQTK